MGEQSLVSLAFKEEQVPEERPKLWMQWSFHLRAPSGFDKNVRILILWWPSEERAKRRIRSYAKMEGGRS